jgi:hypothetical protein
MSNLINKIIKFVADSLPVTKRKLNKEINKVMASLDSVKAQVDVNTALVADLAVIVADLKAKVAAGGLGAEDQAKLDAIAAQLEANNSALTTLKQ